MSIRLDNTAAIRVPTGEPLWTWTDGVDSFGFYVSDGSPEGVITANVGSLAVDAAGGASYRKASGSSNTGWVLADRHILNSDLTNTTGTAKYQTLNNQFLSFRGGTGATDGALLNLNGQTLYALGGQSVSNYGSITLNSSGIDFGLGIVGDIRINGEPGTNGQYLRSRGPGVSPEWEDSATVNITTGSLAAATTARVVDLDNNSLTFDNLDQLTFNGSGLSVFTFDTPTFAIDNPGIGVGGRLSLLDADANRSVSIQSPAVVPTSFTVTLPTAPPTANGQVMTFQTDGTATFATPSVVSRKYSADALGNVSGSVAINFDTGSYDNKSATITANVTTLSLSATRAGYYSIKFKAAAGPYTINWGGVSFFGATPPSSINAEEFLVSLYYDTVDNVWHYLEPETNFFSQDFTATKSLAHKMSGFSLGLYGQTTSIDGSAVELNNLDLILLGGSFATNINYVILDETGMDFNFGAASDLRLDGSAGTAGQVLSSNGPDLPPTWEDMTVVGNTNITNGALLNAADHRAIPMNSKNLTFNAMADLTMVGTTGSTFTFQTQDFIIDNPVSATPGAVTFQDGDNSHNVKIGAPAVTTSSYGITLPPAPPAANNEMMVFQTDGTATFTTTIVGRISADFVIPSGTTLNLVTGVDGNTNAHTVVATGAVGTPSLAGFATQAEFAADFDTEIYFEGVALDKSGTTTGYGVTRVSDTEVSFNFDVPIDSLIYFKRRITG